MQVQRTRISHPAAFTSVKSPCTGKLYHIHGSKVSNRSFALTGEGVKGEHE